MPTTSQQSTSNDDLTSYPLAAGALHLLQQYWGHAAYRPGQAAVIEAVLSGADVLALMATGGGKSVCFQVPTLAREGMAIVISPLVALMKDQVRQLADQGIPAAAAHAGLTHRELDQLLENAAQGVYKFLYLSPERVRTDMFQARLPRMKVNLLVIDEAHCISEWGHDFRPSYRQLAMLRELLPGVPCLALTATATPKVMVDICEQLAMPKATRLVSSFWRPNLSYTALSAPAGKEQKLLTVLHRLPGPCIIYVRARKRAEELANWLQEQAYQALPYHAGLTHEERQHNAEAFLRNACRIMVATSAFGMGVNKPDIQVVIHWDAPPTVEAYYQEAGRAGRDGRQAYAVWLWSETDFETMRRDLEREYPDVETIRRVYQGLGDFFQLPVTSWPEDPLPLDLSELAKRIGLTYTQTWHSLRWAEKNDYLELLDGDAEPPRFMAIVEKLDLYNAGIKNEALTPLVQAMLRGYGGAMFSGYVPLLEDKLCQMLRLSQLQLQRQVQQLAQLKLIHYIPRYEIPLVRFTQPRQPAPNLRIDTRMMAKNKAEDVAAINTLEQLAKDQQHCRQQLLVAYFNADEQTERCGVCDNCQRVQKQQNQKLTLKEQVLQAFAKPAVPATVVAHLSEELGLPSQRVWDSVRLLQDQGLLVSVLGGKLVVA